MPISQPFPEQLKEFENELKTQKSAASTTPTHPPSNIHQLNSTPPPPTTTTKPKRHWLKRLIFGFVGIFLILALTIGVILSELHFVVLNRFVSDIPPIDDSDLQLQLVNIPQEENAFYDFKKIEGYLNSSNYPEEVSKKVLDHLKGKVWDENFAQETLTKNGEALVVFDEAVNKQFQDPRYADPKKVLSNVLNPSLKLDPLKVLKIARLSTLRALYLAHQGKEMEALNEAVKSAEIGQKIQESQVGTLDYLLGFAMKDNGLRTIQKIVATSKLPPEMLLQDAQYIEKFKNNEEGLKTAFKLEYALAVNAIDDTTNGISDELKNKYSDKFDPNRFQNSLKNNFVWQPNKTKAISADTIRAGINEVKKPCKQTTELEIKMPINFATSSSRLKSELDKLLFLTTENLAGKSMYVALASRYNFYVQNGKRCQENFLVSATQIMLALKAYNLDTGGYPTTLDQLVPKYIPKVYEDPFDGKPIKYSPTKKIIYSIGKDRIDSGGSDGDDWLTMPDPTFKIEF
ncbi:MAG: hypothetical protein Q8P91_01630 [bacterium]|nr:hypothetical protein [bacterium]